MHFDICVQEIERAHPTRAEMGTKPIQAGKGEFDPEKLSVSINKEFSKVLHFGNSC